MCLLRLRIKLARVFVDLTDSRETVPDRWTGNRKGSVPNLFVSVEQ